MNTWPRFAFFLLHVVPLLSAALPFISAPAHFAPPASSTNITLWPERYSHIMAPSISDLSPSWYDPSAQPPAFVCYELNFQGDCVLISENAQDVCLSMPKEVMVSKVRSLRQGDGVECRIYNDYACTGSSVSIVTPSNPDLLTKALWNAQIKSLFCQVLAPSQQALTFREATRMQFASRVGEGCWWGYHCNIRRSAPPINNRARELPPLIKGPKGQASHPEHPASSLAVPAPTFVYDPGHNLPKRNAGASRPKGDASPAVVSERDSRWHSFRLPVLTRRENATNGEDASRSGAKGVCGQLAQMTRRAVLHICGNCAGRIYGANLMLDAVAEGSVAEDTTSERRDGGAERAARTSKVHMATEEAQSCDDAVGESALKGERRRRCSAERIG